MRTTIQKSAFFGGALFLTCVLATPADASHGTYRYQGQCHNFHGESHVIEAFSLMDDATRASCRTDRIHTTLAAQRELLTAYREFCDRSARHHLIQARVDLSRYIGHGDLCYLDAAAQHMNAALAIEQRVHAQPVFHGHGQQHRPVHSVSSQPRPQYYGQHGRRTQVRFGGSNFSIGFSF